MSQLRSRSARADLRRRRKRAVEFAANVAPAEDATLAKRPVARAGGPPST